MYCRQDKLSTIFTKIDVQKLIFKKKQIHAAVDILRTAPGACNWKQYDINK